MSDVEQNQGIDSEHAVSKAMQNDTTMIWVVYGLLLSGWIIGPVAIVGGILAYLNKDKAELPSDILSHFNYAWSTFKWALIWCVVGLLLTFVVIGSLVLFGLSIWVTYRVIKGMLAVKDGQPIAQFS